MRRPMGWLLWQSPHRSFWGNITENTKGRSPRSGRAAIVQCVVRSALTGGRASRPCRPAPLCGPRELAHFRYLDHRAQAARADLDTLHFTVDHHAAALQIQVEPAIGLTIRVADIVPIHGFTIAEITTGGHLPPPSFSRALSRAKAATVL